MKVTVEITENDVKVVSEKQIEHTDKAVEAFIECMLGAGFDKESIWSSLKHGCRELEQ